MVSEIQRCLNQRIFFSLLLGTLEYCKYDDRITFHVFYILSTALNVFTWLLSHLSSACAQVSIRGYYK